MLAAGLDGVDRKLDPGAPRNLNMYDYSVEELRKMGVATLPQTLKEALEALEADPLFRDQLGIPMIQEFVAIKEMEWTEYQRHVSDWEINRYLEYY